VVHALLAVPTGLGYDGVFAEQLKKYDGVLGQLRQNCGAQDRLLAQISVRFQIVFGLVRVALLMRLEESRRRMTSSRAPVSLYRTLTTALLPFFFFSF
jgi:hypothetical protein